MSETVQLHALAHGYVQGVGFRAFVRQRARALGLPGYVRNTPEGGVEVIALGPRSILEELLADIQRGPSESEVSFVDVDWQEPQGYLAGFEIRY